MLKRFCIQQMHHINCSISWVSSILKHEPLCSQWKVVPSPPCSGCWLLMPILIAFSTILVPFVLLLRLALIYSLLSSGIYLQKYLCNPFFRTTISRINKWRSSISSHKNNSTDNTLTSHLQLKFMIVPLLSPRVMIPNTLQDWCDYCMANSHRFYTITLQLSQFLCSVLLTRSLLISPPRNFHPTQMLGSKCFVPCTKQLEKHSKTDWHWYTALLKSIQLFYKNRQFQLHPSTEMQTASSVEGGIY